jgi:hypothetical protein
MGFTFNDRQLIKKSKLFDPVYYLFTYPDVRIADVDPLKHFMKIGWKEGRNPSEKFNTQFYLNTYPDVREEGINPLIHYICNGRREGRLTR